LGENLGFAGAKNKDLCGFEGAAEALVCARKMRLHMARSGSPNVNHAAIAPLIPA
jgi:hypothetical protein